MSPPSDAAVRPGASYDFEVEVVVSLSSYENEPAPASNIDLALPCEVCGLPTPTRNDWRVVTCTPCHMEKENGVKSQKWASVREMRFLQSGAIRLSATASGRIPARRCPMRLGLDLTFVKHRTVSLDKRMQLLVDDIAQDDPTSLKEIATRLGWSESMTRRVLAEAEKQGSVAFAGNVTSSKSGGGGRPKALWRLA